MAARATRLYCSRRGGGGRRWRCSSGSPTLLSLPRYKVISLTLSQCGMTSQSTSRFLQGSRFLRTSVTRSFFSQPDKWRGKKRSTWLDDYDERKLPENHFFFGLHGCSRLFRTYILIGPDWSLFNPAALARIRHRRSTADVFRSVCHHYAKLGAQSQSRMTWRLNASTKSGPKWVKRLVLLSSWQVETVTCSNILLLLLLPSPLCSCESFHLSGSPWRIYDSSDASRKTDFYWGMVEGWVKSIKNKKCIFDDIRTDGSSWGKGARTAFLNWWVAIQKRVVELFCLGRGFVGRGF